MSDPKPLPTGAQRASLRRLSHLRDSSSPSHSETFEDATGEQEQEELAVTASAAATFAQQPPPPPPPLPPRRGSSVGPQEVSFVGPFP